MHERKMMMYDESDAFLTLPGGIGTLEELVEVVSWARLGLHRKPIIVLDINGFWAPLKEMFSHFVEKELADKQLVNDLMFVKSVPAVFDTAEKHMLRARA
jgi:uncharacterized protein (TIGR00730 family)